MGNRPRPSGSPFENLARRPWLPRERKTRGGRFLAFPSTPPVTGSASPINTSSAVSVGPCAIRLQAAHKASHETTPGAWPCSPRPTTNTPTSCYKEHLPGYSALLHASSGPQSRRSVLAPGPLPAHRLAPRHEPRTRQEPFAAGLCLWPLPQNRDGCDVWRHATSPRLGCGPAPKAV